jgi:hypothetical protein
MDLSFDNVDLDQPWLSMSIEEVNSMSIEWYKCCDINRKKQLRQSYGKLHDRHKKLRELRETEAEELLKRYKTTMEAEMKGILDK